MNRFYLLFILGCLISCGQVENGFAQSQVIKSKDYELVLPEKQKGLLILFPCFPCGIENTTQEFRIDKLAIKNNFAVLKINFNQHLWLSQEEKNALEFVLLNITKKYNLDTKHTYIGGFSSGGNVSLLLTNHLHKNKSALQPKGVFIIDSPIDLLGLYKDAKEDLDKKSISQVALNEAKWIIKTFDETFGIGDSSLVHYQASSPYSSESHILTNLSHLDDVNIRMYTEPDTLWWKEQRQTDYKHMNAYYINQLYSDLTNKYGKKQVEYITTTNKGYRSNGERHPHSWAIVDQEELIKWMK